MERVFVTLRKHPCTSTPGRGKESSSKRGPVLDRRPYVSGGRRYPTISVHPETRVHWVRSIGKEDPPEPKG